MSVSPDAGTPSRLSCVVEPDHARGILAVHLSNDWPRQAGTIMSTVWLDRAQAAVVVAHLQAALDTWPEVTP